MRLFDESVLRDKAAPIAKIDARVVELAQKLIDTMIKRKGVGISGNQVGVRKRIIAIDLRPCGYKVEPFALINPEIVEANGKARDEEGCLSFPELFIDIDRPEKVKVVAQNLQGEKVEIYADGLLTRILCHEIDHLDGVLFIDYANDEQKALIKEYTHSYQPDRLKVTADQQH